MKKQSPPVVGKIYRRTRGEEPGVYWVCPKIGRKAHVARLYARQRKRPIGMLEVWLLRAAHRHPDWILMRHCRRGIDPFTNERYEVCRLTLIPPDTRLREIKTLPRYAARGSK